MNNKVDLSEYVMHLVFGAIVGLAIGGSIAWWLADILSPYSWLVVVLSVLFFALLGCVYRDRFWKLIAGNALFRLWSK